MDAPHAEVLPSSPNVTEDIEQSPRKDAWELVGRITVKIIVIAMGFALGGVIGIFAGLFSGLIRIHIAC